ncbi:LysE family transporter [Epidermidibacterium keratini]|uniref:LysE family transporter n=1 Tax=Epidermidibacterium keratini TaxID=1891644 RepID=A0A7L4YR88_9ACTN|nr:LysE family translocator [Epidermidibacterium keratini]QHC01572.1 LysE family transporter [Epidermidibacterium keratini]
MIAWHVFLPAAVIVAVIPGANQLLGLRNAALHGVRYALVGMLGRFSAFVLLSVAVVSGLGAIMQRSVIVFEAIRWAGVAYLIWLGISMLRAPGTEPSGEGAPGRSGMYAAARREFLTAITNPKAVLLFAAFLPQFTPRGGSTAVLLLLAAAYIAVEALAAVGYIVAGVVLGRASGALRASPRRLDQAAGVGFLGFGAYLALADRP